MNSENKLEYSIVVPVYNAEKFLRELHDRISNTFKNITLKYELIFVDDGSLDCSWKVLQEIHQLDKKVRIIKLTRNYGQHNATLCGLRNCSGKYIITLDQDLQHPPEEIPKLIQEISKGCSLVYAKYDRKKHHWFRNFGSTITNKIISNLSQNKHRITSFRILKREIVENLDQLDHPCVIIDILFSQVLSPRSVGFVEVFHAPNLRAKSNYNFFKLVNISLNMIFNYTIVPLRLASMVGITLSLLSFSLGLFFLVRYFFGYTTVRGFTALILTISFLFGITLLVLGIMGEYIGRIFLTVNKKPQYKIKIKEE